jgi:sigma-E factor negative regulatory protein RseB
MALRSLAVRIGFTALCGGLGFGTVSAATVERSAAASSAASAPVLAERAARDWLKRIQEAPATRNFQGTFVVSTGGSLSSARLMHFHVRGSQFEMVESLDGRNRQVFRHDDLIQTVWPQARVAIVEQRDKVAVFPALLHDGELRMVEFYQLRVLGTDRVAGRTADVLSMTPRDSWRFANRLWADRETGLLLRMDVLGEDGQPLESSSFSDVRIGIQARPEEILGAMKRLDGYRVIRPTLTPTALENEGWLQRATIPGFRVISCVKRPLHGPGEADAAGVAPQVLQTVFSDGLTHVSIFIEPFSPERHTKQVLTSIGATHTMMVRQGDWWFTIVGDVPAAALRAFAKSVERKR